MISILILTKNEEHDIGGCLDSVSWADDVHVFDSMSVDRTVAIAVSRHANVSQRAFDGYASQRNAALSTLPFKHEWIFVLDADERLSTEMQQELASRIPVLDPSVAALRIRRMDYFLGHHLKRAQIMPYYTRVIRRGSARYVREVNEVLEVDGAIEDLEISIKHFPFSKGLSRWIEKHNTYSTMEAKIFHERLFVKQASLKTALLEADFHTRRVAQKAIFYQLPFRPFLRWCYILFVRGGVLDGHAGIAYATLQAFYEYMIVLKARELKSGSVQH